MKNYKKTKNNLLNQDKILKVFDYAVNNISAYKKFLKGYKINSKKILKNKDIDGIPISNKENYLRAFNLFELVPNNKFPPMISASSGSSGNTYYWPRGDEQEFLGGEIHKNILENIFNLKKKRVLAVVCFSMGNWIAGTFTLASLREVARKTKKFELSIITPGIDKEDVIKILENLAPSFDSVIIAGYPPFLMDIMLSAKENKVNFKKLDLYFILAGENFSEKWRSILLDVSNTPKEINRAISIYGTADAGVLGHETPFTIMLRKLALKNNKLKKDLFGNIAFIPTVVSYYPENIYFETINGDLVFTALAGIPLVRYNIKDHGLLLSKNDAVSILKKHKLYKKLPKNIKKWKYPMVVLKGRNDVAVTFYALNIYPENLKIGLEDKRVVKKVTGKYVVKVENTKNLLEQKFKIAVEVRKGVKIDKNLSILVKKCLFENMIKLNTEYRKLYNSIHEKALPEVTLVENGHEQFVVKKSKHKWIKNN